MFLIPIRQTQLIFAIVLLLCLTVMPLPESFSDSLRYDRNAILDGQWWRMISANFVHLGWGHFFMNAAGALLVLYFFGRCVAPWGWLATFIGSSVFIAAMILWLHPGIYWYVGLSGALHGLFVVGGLADTRVRPLEGWIFLGLIVIKLAWEQVMGALPGSEAMAGGPVLTEAHLYGALGGLLVWGLIRRWMPAS